MHCSPPQTADIHALLRRNPEPRRLRCRPRHPLSEARKFGISVVTANQFLEQYRRRCAPPSWPSYPRLLPALQHGCRQDGPALDGGKHLAETLKNLPKRHMVVKSVPPSARKPFVPTVPQPEGRLLRVIQPLPARWARRRTEIEAEIRQPPPAGKPRSEEVLDGWEIDARAVVQDRERCLLPNSA